MATGDVYLDGLAALQGDASWLTDQAYAVLLDADYTFDRAAHSAYGDVSANEITDSDYAPQQVNGKTISVVAGKVVFDSENVSFGNDVSIAASHMAVLFGSSVSRTTSDLLLFYIDLGSMASLNATFAINTPNGLYAIEPQ